MKLNPFIRTVVLGGIFAVPFIPLVISPSLFFPFITGKGFAYRIIVEIIFALWIILALREEQYRPRISAILFAVTAFIGVIFLADAFGVAPYKSFWSNFERMEGFVALFHHFLYFLVAGTMLASEKLWSLFFHTSIGVSVFIGLYSTLQLGVSGILSNIGLDSLAQYVNLPGEIAINQGGVRVDATFGNAAYLAAYLLIHIFILGFYLSRERLTRAGEVLGSLILGASLFLIYYLSHISPDAVNAGGTGKFLIATAVIMAVGAAFLYIRSRRAIWYSRYTEPAIYVVLITLNLFLLVSSATRGAILGLVGGALLTTIIIALFEKKNRFARRVALGALAVLVLGIGTFLVMKDSEFVRNSPSLSRIATIKLYETQDDGTIAIGGKEAGPRFMIWNIALQGLKERPILGWGQENFNYAFNKFYDPKMYAQEQWFDRAHDVVFDWLTAGGILGLAAYLSIFASLLYYIWKREGGRFTWLRRLVSRVHDGPDNALNVTERALLTGLLAAYFFQNLFVFDNIGTYLLFFSVIAYLHYTHSTPMGALWQKKFTFEQEFVNRVLAPLVIVALAAALYFVNVKPIQAGTLLIDALQKQGQGDVKGSYDSFRKLFAMNTFVNAESREQVVQSAINAAGNQQLDVTTRQSFISLAKAELDKQLVTNPDDARYVLFMGYLLNRSRQAADSIPYLEKAVSLSPKKQTMYFELGGAYLTTGNILKAYETFRTAYELEPKFKDAAILYAMSSIYMGKSDDVKKLLIEAYGTDLVEDDRILKAYFDTKSYDKVIPIVEARVKREPQNFQFRINLAAAYLGVDRRTDAIKALQEAIKIEPRFKEQGDKWIADIRAGRTPTE